MIICDDYSKWPLPQRRVVLCHYSRAIARCTTCVGGYRFIADRLCFLVRYTLRNNANMSHGWQLNITNTKDLYSLVHVTEVLFWLVGGWVGGWVGG